MQLERLLGGRRAYGADEQLVKPLVAEIKSTPPPAGFWPPTKASMPGDDVAADPSIPKSLVVTAVPCLRRPMPWLPPLAALVFPAMSRHTASSTLRLLPASTRMPGRTPVSGAATSLPLIVALIRPLASRAETRIPLPSVWLMVFRPAAVPSPIVTFSAGVSLPAKIRRRYCAAVTAPPAPRLSR